MPARFPLTVSLEEADLRKLDTLAEAEASTAAAYVQTLVTTHLAAHRQQIMSLRVTRPGNGRARPAPPRASRSAEAVDSELLRELMLLKRRTGV